MALHVCSGAVLQCSFGLAPGTLTVLSVNQLMTGYMAAANIMDHIPMVNIMPFGMCTSLANPAVAAATSVAMGVLTPVPCIPVAQAPWSAGAPTVLVNNIPALDNMSTLLCSWGGVISVINPGQGAEQIP